MSQQHFVTLQEARRVNAVKHNRPRDLNHTEQILLAGIALAKKPKYDIEELKDLCKLMLETTGGERLADKLKAAVNDPVAMQSLIEVYPHVEFHNAIKAGVEGLNAFEQLHYQNKPFSTLATMGNTMTNFFALLNELPKKCDTFIYTPWTNVHALRAEWEGNKKEARYLGYVLSTRLQEALNTVLKSNYWNESTLAEIMSAGLLNNKDLWVRIRMGAPESDFVLSFDYNHKFSNNGYVLVATNKKTNCTYHFCV
jgi:hypothetical protein